MRRRFAHLGIAACAVIAASDKLVLTQSPAPPNAPTAQPLAGGQVPPEIEKTLSAANQMISQGQLDPAVQLLSSLLPRYDQVGRVHLSLGSAYHKLKRYNPAKQHLRRALALMPDYAQTNYVLGFCLYYLGDGQAAREAFETFLSRFPKEGHAHFGLGLIDFDADRLDAAAAEFKRAIELSAGDPAKVGYEGSARARLADVYIRQEKFAEAKAELLKATSYIEASPNLYGAFFKLARVLTRLGEHDAAREALKKFEGWKARAKVPEGFPE